MTSTTLRVLGMTCDHCVRALSDAVGRVEGVCAVQVDLDTGTAIVTSGAPVDDAAVRLAIHEAGFEVAP